MIRISFIIQRRIISFEINGKVVRYFDDVWKEGVQILPKDETFVNKLISTRNIEFKMLAAMIIDANSGKNLEEYNSCNTEEDLALYIRRDLISKGFVEVKK